MDKWICSELDQLTLDVNAAMENYDLTKATRLFPPFIDNLSNWYIRRSRKRFWKSENDMDKNFAYKTLFHVLVRLSKLMAPFTPFLAEEIFKNLTKEESVHLRDYPQVDKAGIDHKLNVEMKETRKIIELGLSKRALNKIKVRQPLKSLAYHGKKLVSELEEIIAEEVNVKSVHFLEKGDINSIELDTEISDELRVEGLAREIIRNIQTLRKESGFNVEDRIVVFYMSDSDDLIKAISLDFVMKEVLSNSIKNERGESEGQKEYNIDGNNIWIGISRI